MSNIILPVKPWFVSKILAGEKLFEYRKKLCTQDVSKIYLYATSSVQRILGEVIVKQKLWMDPQELWNLTKDFSGISKEYFDEYFANSQYAGAYELAKPKQYEVPVTLAEVGVNYTPQSFVYCGELRM